MRYWTPLILGAVYLPAVAIANPQTGGDIRNGFNFNLEGTVNPNQLTSQQLGAPTPVPSSISTSSKGGERGTRSSTKRESTSTSDAPFPGSTIDVNKDPQKGGKKTNGTKSSSSNENNTQNETASTLGVAQPTTDLFIQPNNNTAPISIGAAVEIPAVLLLTTTLMGVIGILY